MGQVRYWRDKGIELLWPIIDRLLTLGHRIKPIRNDSAISLELRHHKGAPVMLEDGSQVSAGDMIIEFHFNNAWFQKKRKEPGGDPLGLVWEFLRCIAQDLGYLAELLSQGRFVPNIKALHGHTILGDGARRLGFQVKEVPDTLWKRLAQFYLMGLMQHYHLQGSERFKVGSKPLELKEIWLSRAQLLEKYGPGRPDSPL